MKRIFAIFLFIAIVCSIAVGFYVLYTAQGGAMALKLGLASYGWHDNFRFKNVQGNLTKGLIISGAEFFNMDGMPEGSLIKFQTLNVRLESASPAHVSVDELNGRLYLPRFEGPILLWGSVTKGIIDVNIYAQHIDVEEFVPALPFDGLRKLSGDIERVELFIKGNKDLLHINGTFDITRLSYKAPSLMGAKGSMEMDVRDIGRRSENARGRVKLRGGTVSGPKMAVINLADGAFEFREDVKNPALNFLGYAQVDQVKITISVKGTAQKPEVLLSSMPSASREWLMVMLGTGKSWGSINKSVADQRLSPEIARDFIDYMFLGGSGNKMAEVLGIKEWSVLFTKESRGVKFKKSISSRISAIYGVEQKRSDGAHLSTSTQTIGGEYQLTDTVSVDAERRIKQTGAENVDVQTEPAQEDAQIMLKYKKKF